MRNFREDARLKLSFVRLSTEDHMKRLVVALLALALSGLAHASGLPFAVDSFEKARALSQQNASRHVLVFYTSPD
jgi:hypothetical protein